MKHRTSLLINCSANEASRIRESARHDRRTISGYVMNVLMKAIKFDRSLERARAMGIETRISSLDIERYGLGGVSRPPPGPRTTMMLSCSVEEASEIRKEAESKGTTISGLVLHALRKSWEMIDRTPQSHLFP